MKISFIQYNDFFHITVQILIVPIITINPNIVQT